MGSIIIVLVVATTALSGIAAGASLDVSIRQLPARHRMGVMAYSVYSQATAPCHGQDLVSPSWHWYTAACSCHGADRLLSEGVTSPCAADLPGGNLVGGASAHHAHLGITDASSPTAGRP